MNDPVCPYTCNQLHEQNLLQMDLWTGGCRADGPVERAKAVAPD